MRGRTTAAKGLDAAPQFGRPSLVTAVVSNDHVGRTIWLLQPQLEKNQKHILHFSPHLNRQTAKGTPKIKAALRGTNQLKPSWQQALQSQGRHTQL